MTHDTPSLDSVRERAAYWVAKLNDSDLSDSERSDLHAWLFADPRHAEEFRAHNALVALAREFPSQLQARLEGYAPPNVKGSESMSPRRTWPFAVAAALLLALVAGGWFVFGPMGPASQVYATKTGEMRTVTFEDGSVAYLNTRTQISWLGGKHERRVALGEGEALFDIVHDAARPFSVVLDNSEIRVLGTRFNVYRKKNGEVVVTVIEGKVAVRELAPQDERPAWEREVGANQQIVYRPLGLMRDVHPAAAATAVKWRDGVLELKDQPLSEALDELTRYTDQRIVIRDPRIAELRVGGAVSVRDVRAALARLEKLAPVRVVESGGTYTLDYETKNERQ
jgi:transmembrane sensor